MKDKKIGVVLIFILLIFLVSYLPSIPIQLLNLDINSWSKPSIILYSAFCDIGCMIIIFFIYKKDIIKDFRDLKNNFTEILKLAFKYYFIGLAIMIISNIMIANFLSDATANNEELIREYINLYPLYMFFSISIYAPFVEEIIYRKAIYNFFTKDNIMNKYLYIIISGFIFSGMHVLGLGDNAIDYIYIIPYMALGIAFSGLYYKSKNIFSTIMMHAFHNVVNILLYLLVGVIG